MEASWDRGIKAGPTYGLQRQAHFDEIRSTQQRTSASNGLSKKLMRINS